MVILIIVIEFVFHHQRSAFINRTLVNERWSCEDRLCQATDFPNRLSTADEIVYLLSCSKIGSKLARNSFFLRLLHTYSKGIRVPEYDGPQTRRHRNARDPRTW